MITPVSMISGMIMMMMMMAGWCCRLPRSPVVRSMGKITDNLVTGNDEDCIGIISNGGNVAMVTMMIVHDIIVCNDGNCDTVVMKMMHTVKIFIHVLISLQRQSRGPFTGKPIKVIICMF